MRSFAIFLLLAPAVARADAVLAPPDDCPDGATGTTGHLGTYCEPAPCRSDNDCEAGTHCAPASLCTREVELEGVTIRGSITTRVVVAIGACNEGCTSRTDTAVRSRGAPSVGRPTGAPRCEEGSFCVRPRPATTPAPPPPPTITRTPSSPPASETPPATRPAPSDEGCSAAPARRGSHAIAWILAFSGLILLTRRRR
ncbi:MAG: hypothetical protein IT378_09970 [Sandaracinaceae bacterium]|nr:hypothetical protein [Sandaracinaceae bacterium]